jgi:hypothetical protein
MIWLPQERTNGKKNSNRKHIPKISPQVNNLPCAKPNQHTHRAEGKPLHSLIRALICVPQFLLAGSQIFHLFDNLLYQFLHPSKINLDRLKLLLGLDTRPISGISANVNIKFDVTGRVIGSSGFCNVFVTQIISSRNFTQSTCSLKTCLVALIPCIHLLVFHFFFSLHFIPLPLFLADKIFRKDNKKKRKETHTSESKLIIKANVKRGISRGRECLSSLACDIFRMAVFVSERVLDLT